MPFADRGSADIGGPRLLNAALPASRDRSIRSSALIHRFD
jgi:hypothetical protein